MVHLRSSDWYLLFGAWLESLPICVNWHAATLIPRAAPNTISRIHYAPHLGKRLTLLPIRRDRLREPTRGDRGRWHHAHLRQQRQRDRDRLPGLHLGLAQPPGHSRENRWWDHHLRLRSHRPEDVPGDGQRDHPYPNRYYNVASSSLTATTRKHISSPRMGRSLRGWWASGTANASTTYLHPDHLGGTNVVTDEDREVVQNLAYYPTARSAFASGSFNEQHPEHPHSECSWAHTSSRSFHLNHGYSGTLLRPALEELRRDVRRDPLHGTDGEEAPF